MIEIVWKIEAPPNDDDLYTVIYDAPIISTENGELHLLLDGESAED